MEDKLKLKKGSAMNKIIATDKTIKQIVRDEIERLGNDADLNHIDTSQVTNMSSLFLRSEFNGDISKWDVSKVTDMYGMFSDAYSFNGNISCWDVSNVLSMTGMFYKAESFNQNIGNWDVSNVTNMSYMFYGAQSFNQDISKWKLNIDVDLKNMCFRTPLKNKIKVVQSLVWIHNDTQKKEI
jgi:surface protein